MSVFQPRWLISLCCGRAAQQILFLKVHQVHFLSSRFYYLGDVLQSAAENTLNRRPSGSVQITTQHIHIRRSQSETQQPIILQERMWQLAWCCQAAAQRAQCLFKTGYDCEVELLEKVVSSSRLSLKQAKTGLCTIRCDKLFISGKETLLCRLKSVLFILFLLRDTVFDIKTGFISFWLQLPPTGPVRFW